MQKIIIAIIFVIFLLNFTSFEYLNPKLDPSQEPEDTFTHQIHNKLSLVSLPFIENQGQIDKQVKFYAKTFAGTVYVTENELTYHSVKQNENSHTSIIIKEKFIDGILQPYGIQKHPSTVNYFKGTEDNWKTHIPTYSSISLGPVWDDIDVSLAAYGNNLEKIFTVHPNGNISDIKATFDGITGLSISDGELILHTTGGQLSLTKPIAYQIIDGIKTYVTVYYTLVDSVTYGFDVANYDNSYALVIDPLIASTLIGGDASVSGKGDRSTNIALDSSGNVYISGLTRDGTIDWPVTAGVIQTTFGGDISDAFVSKFTSDLTTLSASTFLGGSGEDDIGGMKIDSSGNVVITGWSEDAATDWPVTAGVFQTTHAGPLTSTDSVVAVLNSDLTTLSASTFIGGDGFDFGDGDVALDSSGNIIITGYAQNSGVDFPTTVGAYDTTHNSAVYDVYVSKFTSDLTTLSASTFIGGSENDFGHELFLDSSNNIYVTGQTVDGATDFPTTGGAYDTTHNGAADGFIAKFTSDLTTLSAATFVGGSGTDTTGRMQIDSSGNLILSAGTADATTNFVATSGAYDESHNGGNDIIILKFTSDLTTLSAATFVGGSGDDAAHIKIDSSDNVYFTGYTVDATTDFPVTSGAFDETHNGGEDGFIAKLNPTLTTLLFSTFIGGSGDDRAHHLVLDSSNNIYITGQTDDSTTDWPTTSNAYDTTHNGVDDAFVTHFSITASTVSEGSSKTVTVLAGGTGEFQYTEAAKTISLGVKLPAGTAGSITVATAVEKNLQSGTTLATAADISGPCTGGCTITFTVPNSVLTDLGLSPSSVSIYHDSNGNNLLEPGEAITTTRDTTTTPGSTIFTGQASFTSKFAVGGIAAQAVAGAAAAASTLGLLNQDKCDSDGFASGVSLRVYEISYDKCDANTIIIHADSTCKPIRVKVATPYGVANAGMSSTQPFLEDDPRKIIYSHPIDEDSEWFNVIIQDKRDDFTEKIYTNQCSDTIQFKHTSGYFEDSILGYSDTNSTGNSIENSEEESLKPTTLEPTDTTEPEQIPTWIKNNARWWSEGIMTDSEFTTGIQYMVSSDIIHIDDLPEVTGGGDESIPSWIKNNAQLWFDGVITDADFANGIKYLIENGIVRIS